MTSRTFSFLTVLLSLLFLPSAAQAFCGFYVAKADASLYNKASQVVIARDGNRTVLSMMNDYQGELKEFAMVIPVPSVLEKGQINVGDKAMFERIDAFTAPRLVEYFDPDPCVRVRLELQVFSDVTGGSVAEGAPSRSKSRGVKVEAEYTVGEYDIVILSAKESDGLEAWLQENNYNIPDGASEALRPYIKQGLKFFVARVNLEEHSKAGLSYLRPLQVAFESEKFMLPIRLGMLNANGDQELLVYVLTKSGRVETTNYRTVKLPTGTELPVYVKEEFGPFYKSMFSEQVKRESGKAVFLEYFWNMGWCDPCASDPLSPKELKKLGVFWLKDQNKPITGRFQGRPGNGPLPVMVTRLHARYNKSTFPDDLRFQETGDKTNFQARYVLRHPWKGDYESCSEEMADSYKERTRGRMNKEVETLANLTGWDSGDIREKVDFTAFKGGKGSAVQDKDKWWNSIW